MRVVPTTVTEGRSLSGGPAGPPTRAVRWPLPLPGRVRWAWLLGTRYRGFRLRSLLALLDGRVRAGARLVSLGSGPGYDAALLARRQASEPLSWTLLEPQAGMWGNGARLSRIAGRPFAPALVRGDNADLPFRSDAFDIVLSIGVLCCVEDAFVPAVVAETVRVLRPGGYLLFGVPRSRGSDDERRWERAGLVSVATTRPGRSLLQKPL